MWGVTTAALPDRRGLYELLEDLSAQVAEVRQMILELRRPEAEVGWFSVKSAAEYLDTTEEALRGLIKRGQVPVHRTPHGRLLLHRDELDAYVRGDQT